MTEISELVNQVVYGMVIPAVITALGGLAVVYVRKLSQAAIKKVESETKIQISDATEAKIDALVVRAVKAVEEMAQTAVKKKGAKSPVKLKGDEKLEIAMSKVKNGLDKMGLEADEDEIKDRIHDVVDSMRSKRNGKAGGSLGE